MLFTTCRSNSKSHDQHFAKLMLNTVGMSAPSLGPDSQVCIYIPPNGFNSRQLAEKPS